MSVGTLCLAGIIVLLCIKPKDEKVDAFINKAGINTYYTLTKGKGEFVNGKDWTCVIRVGKVYKGMEINENKKVNEITKQERNALVKLIKNIELTIDKTRPIEEGIITSGGINIKEINPSTMESKLVKNLYFAGEIIDVDAYTGGFNLQIAYSTGYTAGMLK